MQFLSPRFRGDHLLESILLDPDTGQVKLGPGSPSKQVGLVQQALADLGWPQQTDPPIDVEGFADGEWGPKTEETVLAYKFVFHLRYSPGPGPGILDAYVGPRTIELLDAHIAGFDFASAAMDARVAELTAAGRAVTNQRRTGLYTRTRITWRQLSIDGEESVLYHHPATGVCLVSTAIAAVHHDRPHLYGAPLGDEHDAPDGSREVNFQTGTISYDPPTGDTSTGSMTPPDLVY